MATNPPIYPQPPKSNLPLALAGGAIVAMLAGNIYLFVQIQDLKKDASKSSDAKQLREQISATARQSYAEAQAAAQRAKQEAMSSSEQTAKKLQQEQEQTA